MARVSTYVDYLEIELVQVSLEVSNFPSRYHIVRGQAIFSSAPDESIVLQTGKCRSPAALRPYSPRVKQEVLPRHLPLRSTSGVQALSPLGPMF